MNNALKALLPYHTYHSEQIAVFEIPMDAFHGDKLKELYSEIDKQPIVIFIGNYKNRYTLRFSNQDQGKQFGFLFELAITPSK